MTFRVRWLGRVPYREAWAVQRGLHAHSPDNYLLLLEHPHVFTYRRAAHISHVLVPPHEAGAELVRTDRGGDVTYHGPGQLVGYPIVTVPQRPAAYVHTIERLIVDALSDLGLPHVGRLAGYPGVWVDPEGDNPRKVCAVGVRLVRGRSMHGFALNVAPDMRYWDYIVPCGLPDKGVTSLAAEGVEVSMQQVVDAVASRAGALWRSGSDGPEVEIDRQDVVFTRGNRPRTNRPPTALDVEESASVADTAAARGDRDYWDHSFGPDSHESVRSDGLTNAVGPVGSVDAAGSVGREGREVAVGSVKSVGSNEPVGPDTSIERDGSLQSPRSVASRESVGRDGLDQSVASDESPEVGRAISVHVGDGTSLQLRSRLHQAGVTEGLQISARKPKWLRSTFRTAPSYLKLKHTMRDLGLVTVCEEAGCPNIFECWADGTATFMINGERCTRACGFCLVDTQHPVALDPEEPERVAEAVARMGLGFAVVTAVARDDLPDGGAGAFAETIRAVRRRTPQVEIEVLVPDVKGDEQALQVMFEARPDVLNHNVETVPRLQRAVRPSAGYARSLSVLARAKEAGLTTKSGLIVGMGETDDEVVATLADLHGVGVDIVTIGQYLRPTAAHLPVARWVEPATFEAYATAGEALGIPHVESSPLTRSSYHARQAATHVTAAPHAATS